MAKKKNFSWGQMLLGAAVAFPLAFFLLPISDDRTIQLGAAGGIAVLFGLVAGRFGEDAWHATGSLW